MKVFIPIETNDVNSEISSFFCKSKYFLLKDLENDTFEIIENNFSSENRGIKVANMAIDKKIDFVILKNIGPRGFNIFKNANVKIYLVKDMLVNMALELLKDGKLEELKEIKSNCSCKSN
ncbi:MAG: hypothetical protein K1060chlam5_00194 [Candidatus Anoxychlamydiales bacterium]|nr:hypothetical protein [Candidatus Anoxychlamydiales bacterium]